MKVTIEREHGKIQRFWYNLLLYWDLREAFFPRDYHRLYATVELTNEELFVIQKTNSYFATLVEGDADYGHRDIRPRVYGADVVGFNGKKHSQRHLVFKHTDIQWVNRLEGLLKEGLEKWKKDIDAQAKVFEKPIKDKDTYELG